MIPFDFHLSHEAALLGARIVDARRRGELRLDDLIVDQYSAHWREMLAIVHNHAGNGRNESIAVIDSGYASEIAGACGIDEHRSKDFTGEGVEDRVGHGTAIAILTNLVAPLATQYHVKVYGAGGVMPGSSYDDIVKLVRKAFRHVKSTGAKLVNISWNHLTGFHDHDPRNVRPNFACHCPVCQIITDFIEDTGADVFVSEGNYYYVTGDAEEERETGSWPCPASATSAVPVLGFDDGRRRYNTNIDLSAAIPAPAQVRIRLGAVTEALTGSSFSTPLVLGTYAAARSAFRDSGLNVFSIPRIKDVEGGGSTDYSFPLDLFFVPPNDPNIELSARHTNWHGLLFNCRHVAARLEKNGDYVPAGALCGLAADLVAAVHARMKDGVDRAFLGGQAIEFYILTIQLLQHSKTAARAAEYIGKAEGMVERLRGQIELSGIEEILKSASARQISMRAE